MVRGGFQRALNRSDIARAVIDDGKAGHAAGSTPDNGRLSSPIADFLSLFDKPDVRL